MRPPSLSRRPAIVSAPAASGATIGAWPLEGGVTLPLPPLLPLLSSVPFPVLPPVPGVVPPLVGTVATAPRLPSARLVTLPAVIPSAWRPVCSMLPPWLRADDASTCSRCAFKVPPLLSRSAGVVRCNSRLALSVPALAMPPLAATRVSCCDCNVPVFSSRPSTVTSNSPARAPMLPALRTPTPFSLPTSQILLANMPPSAPTSSAKVGAGPLAACGVTRAWSALTTLLPRLACSWLAQMPALTCSERVIRSV